MVVNIDKAKKTVTIVLPLNEAGTLTKNGDRALVASTRGNVSVEHAGTVYSVGCNVTAAKQ